MLFGKIPVPKKEETVVGWLVPYKVLGSPDQPRSERGTHSKFNLVKSTVKATVLDDGQIRVRTTRVSPFKPFNLDITGSQATVEDAISKWETELHSLEQSNLRGVPGNTRGYDFQPAYNENE